VVLIHGFVPEAAAEEERHDGDGDDDGGDDQQQAEQQHFAQRHVQEACQGEGCDAGNREDDAAFAGDGHGGGHACSAEFADFGCQLAGQRGRDDEQDVQENGLQHRSDGQAHGVRQALGAERGQQVLHEAPDGSALVEDGAHEDAEGDEQADVHHDVTESGGDGFDGLFDAEADGEAKVHGADHQGDDGVDSETDNQQHGGEHRDGCVDQDSDV
jgi:hypothetical protein